MPYFISFLTSQTEKNMIRRFLWAAVFCQLLIGSYAVNANGNLLPNGGLESASGPSDYVYLHNNDSSIPSWTVSYDGVGEQSYWWRTGHVSEGVGAHYAAEGVLAIDLNGGDSMTTSFVTVPGTAYDFHFYGSSNVPLQVQVGNLNQSVSVGQGFLTGLKEDDVGTFWRSFDFSFVATSGNSSLILTNQAGSQQFGAWVLDGMSVTASVPEPTTAILLGLGALIGMKRGLRRRTSH